jgi:RNA polymerase sigma-70 factor (ECF subfamily)
MTAETPLTLLERLRCQPRDDDGWQRLLALYTAWLQAWTRRLTGLPADDADAVDAVQGVFAIVSRELPRFEHNGRTGAFRTWLKAILVNCLRDWQRQRRRQSAQGDSLLDQLTDPQSGLSQEWEREHQKHVIDQLFVRGRQHFTAYAWQAFERTVVEEQPASRVASELNVSVNAVLLAKSRVLAWLRREGGDLLE